MSGEHRDRAAEMQDQAETYWGKAVASGRTVRAREPHTRPPEPHRYRTVEGHEAVVTSVGTDGRLHGHVPGQFTATWWHPDGRHNLARNFDLAVDRSMEQMAAQDPAARPGSQARTEQSEESGIEL